MTTATEQTELTLDAITIPEPAATVAEQFAAFRAANPSLERLLVRLAREYLAAGHTKVGMKALWERVRWEYGIQTGTTPRLNNNWPSRWSRALMADYPDLAGVFETRELRAP